MPKFGWGIIGVTLATLVMAIFSCFIPGIRESNPPLITVDFVDIERYQGTWHEIARLPTWFQRNCRQASATYKLIGPGVISVENTCIGTDGQRQSIRGTATVVDSQTNAKLAVVFDTWFFKLFGGLIKGKYWILFIDPDYQTAIVGTPDRNYLWILSRTLTLPEARYQELVSHCSKLGFNTDKLIKNQTP